MLDCGFRVDVLVEDAVVGEVKAVEAIRPVHEAQLMSYMKLGGWCSKSPTTEGTEDTEDTENALRMKGWEEE